MAKRRKRVFDEYWIRDYCKRKLQQGGWPIEDDTDRQYIAEKEFSRLKDGKVQAWCEKWLSDQQKTQLDGAIRAKLKRENDKQTDGYKTITLKRKAWLYLSTLAKRDNVTISEFLEKRLMKEYDQQA